jgi:hypothetical protein
MLARVSGPLKGLVTNAPPVCAVGVPGETTQDVPEPDTIIPVYVPPDVPAPAIVIVWFAAKPVPLTTVTEVELAVVVAVVVVVAAPAPCNQKKRSLPLIATTLTAPRLPATAGDCNSSPELLDCCGATVAWVQGDPLVQPDAPAGSDHVSSSAGARLTITTELPVHAIPLIIRAPLATTARAGIAGIDD